MNGIQKTEKEARAYAAAMEHVHNDGEQWLPFVIPAGSRARRFGRYGCVRASERADYERGGAKFLDPIEATNAT